MFLFCSHVCFLPTAAEDVMKSMTHSSAVSDGVTDDGIVYNGCQHTHERALQLNMEDHITGG